MGRDCRSLLASHLTLKLESPMDSIRDQIGQKTASTSFCQKYYRQLFMLWNITRMYVCENFLLKNQNIHYDGCRTITLTEKKNWYKIYFLFL